jgi:hypothetical protein
MKPPALQKERGRIILQMNSVVPSTMPTTAMPTEGK